MTQTKTQTKKNTAVVTGASRGIGRAIALQLAQDGYNIVLNYRSNEEQAKQVQSEIEAHGVECLLVQGDVSKEEDCQRIFDSSVEAFGTVEVLVNNAGITKDKLLIRMQEEDYDSVMDTNMKSVFLTSKMYSRHMIKNRNGRIINISSIVGMTGNAGQSNYAASKGAVISFTKSLAKEISGKNVLVNAVAPGFIHSEMTDVLPADVVKQYESMIPQRRLGEVEDIAKVVSFLAGKNSSYITGQVLCVDGGLTM